MSVRGIIIIALAVVCGLTSALGAMHLGIGGREVAATTDGTVSILVAKADIAKGQTVSAELVSTAQWPAGHAPEGAITDLAQLQDRVALGLIVADEPILENKLGVKGSGAGISGVIPHGKRAYTIQASGVASNVAGFVRPGNLVDVLLNLKGGDEERTGGGTTTTLLQAVEILAVDQKIDNSTVVEEGKIAEAEEVSSVTLVVTPQQATLLDLGQNLGKLTLSLRNPEDISEAKTLAVTVDDIRYLGLPPDVLENLKKDGQLSSSSGMPSTRELPQFEEIRTLRGTQWGRVRTPVGR